MCEVLIELLTFGDQHFGSGTGNIDWEQKGEVQDRLNERGMAKSTRYTLRCLAYTAQMVVAVGIVVVAVRSATQTVERRGWWWIL